MSGDERALQHPEHGRSEFRDIVDNAAGVREKGKNGCVCDAYSVHFQAELPGFSDGGLRELRVVRVPIGNNENYFAWLRHGMKLLHGPPQGGIQRGVTGS